jgi:hypothetical protein
VNTVVSHVRPKAVLWIDDSHRTLILHHHHASLRLPIYSHSQVHLTSNLTLLKSLQLKCTHSTQNPAKKRCPTLPAVQRRRKCTASARYRERCVVHCPTDMPRNSSRRSESELRRRAHLKTPKEGDDELEHARAQARMNSAHYCAQCVATWSQSPIPLISSFTETGSISL